MAGIYGISKKGRYFEDFQEVFYFSGTLTAGVDEGKAVTLDATADKTVKLAGDGDDILGRLEVIENRIQEGIKVCTVSLKFIDWVPVKSGLTGISAVAVGDSVVGSSTAGSVKASNDGTSKVPLHGNKVVFLDATKGAHVIFI